MSINLTMNFSVNTENNTITVNREFKADLELVWQAFTTSEILDLWWAPAPWKAKTKSMNFCEGGQWLYAMVSPEGEEHWSFANYKRIQNLKSFTALDGFADANGKINTNMPQANWETIFNNNGDTSLVTIEISYNSTEELESMIKMGFKEGFAMGLNQLEQLLINLKSQ